MSVFGKPPKKSKDLSSSISSQNAPFESTEEAPSAPNKRSSLRSSVATEAHLRIVSLQIGEREAINTIKGICQEAKDHFGMTTKTEEITDLLSGLLLIGDLVKRIGKEKLHFEMTLDRRVKEYEDVIAHKNDLMEQMETMINRLQAENAQAEDHLQEEKMRHSHRITIMNKEMHNTREELADLKKDNEVLRMKLIQQEKSLMNIPRLEEQYMRNARSAVRQSEAANTLNRIEFRKMEEEMKNMTFWKNKAKSMEETIFRLQQENEALDQHQRTTFSKYQNLLRTTRNTNKRDTATIDHGHTVTTMGGTIDGGNNPQRPVSAITANKSSHTTTVTTAGTTAPGKRPVSAPSTRRLPPASTTTTSTSNQNVAKAKNYTAGSNSSSSSIDAGELGAGNAHNHSYTSSHSSSKQQQVNNATAADEIIRLRGEVRKKDRLIAQLSQRLSYARAHPLLSTSETHDRKKRKGKKSAGERKGGHENGVGDHSSDEGRSIGSQNSDNESSDDDDIHNKQKSAAKTLDLVRSNNLLIGTELQHLPYMNDEYEGEDDPFFHLEEIALQEERMRKAMELQLQFSVHQQERRSQGPAHIVAIRKARNFGKVIDDLVSERDQAFLQQKLATSDRDILFAPGNNTKY